MTLPKDMGDMKVRAFTEMAGKRRRCVVSFITFHQEHRDRSKCKVYEEMVFV